MNTSRFIRFAVALNLLPGTAAMATQASPPHVQTQAPTPSGLVVISGAVPDEATKAAFLTRLKELYGPGQIVDQITVGGVIAPPNWSTHIQKLVTPNLKSISKGQLVVEGTTITMRGEVGNEATRQAIASDYANALTSAYVIKNALRVSTTSQALIDQTLANRVIEFEVGSALLTESGKQILDEMSGALQKINAKKIEIIGHTDNQGTQSHNHALSLARAESVRIYLVTRGLAPGFFMASGMGADQPMVPNTTEEGRKRNRRIEFRVSQ
jgi:OmpA-OmpF porin, OOP family